VLPICSRGPDGLDLARQLLGFHVAPTDRVGHYAQPFCLSGQWFRMVFAGDGMGHPRHCPYRPEWKGRWKDAAGKWPHGGSVRWAQGPT
jgi:hypothetical protein